MSGIPDTAAAIPPAIVGGAPVRAEARPTFRQLNEAERESAGKARGELRERAEKLGIRPFGWSEIRKAGDFSDWFKDADPSNNKPAGLLRQVDSSKGVNDKWEADEKTKDYLANAQRRAVELAKEGMEKINTELGIDPDKITTTNFGDIVKAAEAKGWKVDPNTGEGQETLDYLRNAHEYAREEQQRIEAQKAAQAATVAAAAAGIEGDPTKALQQIAGSFVIEKNKRGKVVLSLDIEGLNQTVEDVLKNEEAQPAARAAAYDFRIASFQYQLAQVDTAYEEYASSKGWTEHQLQKARENLRKQLELQIGTSRQERAKITQSESQVERIAKKFAGDNEEDKKLAEKNPLQLLEKKFNDAIRPNSESRAGFIQILNNMTDELPEQERELFAPVVGFINDLLNNTLSEQSKANFEKIRSRILTGGGISLALLFVMFWMSSKELQGGGEH